MSDSAHDAQRKRKRSVDDNDDDAHQDARSIPASQDARGVFVDIPELSSSAMAAFHAAQHPPSSQLDSQIFIHFPDSQAQPQQSSSTSEYFPSTQAEDHSSSSAPAVAETASALRPLPSISTRVFEPYLDDTTGMELEQAESRISRNRVQPAASTQIDSSSPVESFSPSDQVQQMIKPQDIPRIGSWILPPLTAENSNPNVPDYSSQQVLSQIPLDMDPDELIDPEDLFRESIASQSSPSHRINRAEQQHRKQAIVSPASADAALPVAVSPIQSTPALASVAAAGSAQPDPLLPSQPIPSQPQDAPSSTPALPPPPAVTQDPTQPPTAIASSSSADSSSTTSVGWSTLPRPEIIDLVHQSSHIPDFLKDEIERFVLRSNRASSPKTAATPRASPRRRFQSQSQSQSQSQNNDDSETQEDGFLRTKKIWCMDLLIFPSDSQSRSRAVEGVTSQVVLKLTQQTQQSQQLSQSPNSQRGAVAIILLLDTVEATFDVYELEESLAGVLRNDRRYGVAFDAGGRKWAGPQETRSLVDATRDSPGDELEQARAEITRLQLSLETAAVQIESLSSAKTSLEKDLSETRSQHDFVRGLYDRASASASTAQAAASGAEAQVHVLQGQLRDGLSLHRDMLAAAVDRWKSKIRAMEVESKFLREQTSLTELAGIREKAALWDAYQAREAEAERKRAERIRLHEESQRLRGFGDAGPFAPPPAASAQRDTTPIDELDELASLAREAAEAGDTLFIDDLPTSTGRRSRRSKPDSVALGRAANRPPPGSAVEMAEQVEAAQLSAENALLDAGREVEDQFAVFAAPEEEGKGEVDGLGDFDAAPSGGLRVVAGEEELFAGERGEERMWGEQVDVANLPPSFTEDSLLLGNGEPLPLSAVLTGETGSGEGSFQPHTQA